MREKAGIPDLLPPQLFNGDTYCGVSNLIVINNQMHILFEASILILICRKIIHYKYQSKGVNVKNMEI